MDSLKRILKSALDDRSPRFILATIAFGVVVALLAGTLIGYKLDNRSGGSTTKAKTTKVKKAKAKKASGKTATVKQAPVLFGSVVSARPAKIVVLGAAKKRVPLVVTSRTIVEVARPGKSSSIAVGSHVLYVSRPGSTKTAAEIVVLPSTSRLGTPVTAVSSTSMTISYYGTVVVRTSGATVSLTAAANRSRIPKGSRVAVSYSPSRRTNSALEVAIFAAGSKL